MAEAVAGIRYELTVPQGSEWGQAFQVTQYDMQGTTWVGECQIRRTIGDPEVLTTLDVSIDVEDQIVWLDIAPAISSAWAWREAVYAIEIQDAQVANRRIRVAQGPIYVDPEVVR